MENQINSLVKQAQIVQHSLQGLEKNKKHYQKAAEARTVVEGGVLTNQLQKDSIDNKMQGHPEVCEKGVHVVEE
jgi:hypothetical protein